ncbi:InlB B-repeat-containing protein [Lachnospiraceae bacterium C1.1]|nr:InlB B-repeat-containing protein [Lachnospiraceae bacterium C1.1]
MFYLFRKYINKRYIAAILALVMMISLCVSNHSIYANEGNEAAVEDQNPANESKNEDDSRSNNSKDDTEAESSGDINDHEHEEDEEESEEGHDKDAEEDEEDEESRSENELDEDDEVKDPNNSELAEITLEAEIFKNSNYEKLEEDTEEYRQEINTGIRIKGVMPANSYAKAYPVEVGIDDKNVIAAYDISIFYRDENDGEKIFQPNETEESGSVNVDITNDAIRAAIETNGDLSLYHAENEYASSEEFEPVDFERSGDGDYDAALSFTAECFSVYAVVDDNPALRTYEFYTLSDNEYVPYYFEMDTGELVYKQVVKNGDSISVPQLPAYESKTFSGWFVYDAVTDTYDEEPIDFNDIPEITESETVILRAVFANYAYVIFHEQYTGSSESWPIIESKRIELDDNGEGTAVISDVIVTYNDDEGGSSAKKVFKGWTPTLTSPDTADPADMLTEDSITVTTNINLYPIFDTVNWLSFWSGGTGSGASYVASKFLYNGDCVRTEDLEAPRLTGYSFAGWYTASENGTQVTDANLNILNGVDEGGIITENDRIYISSDTTLYAHWNKADTKYTVILWKESLNDQVEGNSNSSYSVDAPTYDFSESFTFDARTGDVINISSLSEYTGLDDSGDYKYFYYSSSDTDSITVKADGSSVINIYYRRYYAVYKFYTKAWVNWNEDQSYRCEGLYGQALSSIGKIWPSEYSIYETSDTSSSGTKMTYLETLNYFTGGTVAKDEVNHVYTSSFYIGSRINANTWVVFVRQALDGTFVNGEKYTANIEASGNLNFNITEKFMGFTVCGYSRSLADSGFTEVAPGDVIQLTRGSTTYVYFERDKYTFSFIDTYDNGVIEEKEVYYGASLSDNIADDPVSKIEGKTFGGWYSDGSCANGSEFNFAQTMPMHNIAAYAKWEAIWYLINIDPNFGELAEGDSTWFWEEYRGDKIVEYTQTTRNFMPALNGDHYYHINRHSDLGVGDEWSPLESGRPRKAYYTQDIDDATDLSEAYVSANDVYRYAGWYEVDENGKETLYNFDSEITHNVYLKLRWKEVGTYCIRYDAGEGGIDSTDGNEDTFRTMDESDYTDNANVIVSRIATPPEGYNFIGWSIRQDDSGKIYYPGDTLKYRSKFAILESSGRRVLILDAVYTKMDTISLTYDANGGTVSADGLDYGTVSENGDYTSKDHTSDTATIGGMTNNKEIVLSSGSGFSYGNFEFKGWNTKPDYSGTHFDAGQTCRVDNIGSNVLYAEWSTKVFFDINNDNADWDVSDMDLTEYSNNLYYREVILFSSVSEPNAAVPVSSVSDDMFAYWTAVRYTKDEAKAVEYDFSQQVTGELVLYGYWTSPIQVPVHAADASEEIIQDKTSVWIKSPRYLEVRTDSVYNLPEVMMDENYVDVPDGYGSAFACTKTKYGEISDENEITELSYDIEDKSVKVTYKDGTVADLASEEEIYFVYFKVPITLTISYKKMNNDLTLENVVRQSPTAPTSAVISKSGYSMDENISNPLNLAYSSNYVSTQSQYNYFAYAIGDPSAADDSMLHFITEASDSNSSRPSVKIRNNWRGFEYSTDNGETWVNYGYEAALYVIYYETVPTIITISENTVGRKADDEQQFNYNVVIGQRITGRNGNQISETTVSSSSVSLKHGQTESYTLFYWTESYLVRTYYYEQYIRITQETVDGFATTNSGISSTSNLISTSTADSSGGSATVTYTNRHTPMKVELHVAKSVAGQLVAADGLRTDDSSVYTAEITIGSSISLSESNPHIFAGDDAAYGFAGIVYGTCSDNVITAEGRGINSISYQKLSDSRYYGLCLNGNEDTLLKDYELFYVYYEKPRVYYMEKDASGNISRIDDIRRNGSAVSLNGVQLEQGAVLDIGNTEFVISNSSGTNYWHFPPNLDGTKNLSLRFLGIGAGEPDALTTDELDMDTASMRIKADNGVVKYRTGSVGSWVSFKDSPVIYVIYNEPASYISISNNSARALTYRLTVYSGAYKEDILRKNGDETETVEAILNNSGESYYYTLNIPENSSDILCILNAVDMTYQIQVLDNDGNVISAGNYSDFGFKLEDDSDPEFGTLVMGPEFEGPDSFEESLGNGTCARIGYVSVLIPAATMFNSMKQPFIWMIILAVLMGISVLLVKGRKDQESRAKRKEKRHE